MKTLKDFTGLYQVTRTVSVELKPFTFEGQNNVFWDSYLQSTMFKHDNDRAEAYQVVKTILDSFHKRFIAESLSNVEIDWTYLFDYYKGKDKKAFKKEQDEIRKKIVDEYFHKDERWNYINQNYSELIEKELPRLLSDDAFVNDILSTNEFTIEMLSTSVAIFKRFSIYFKKYFKNRLNMYSPEAQTTSIANRIVNQNFIKFADDIIVYKRLKTICPKELQFVEVNLHTYLGDKSFDDVFTPNYFNHCVTQKGIELFNWIIGGNPNENIIGINSVGNEFLQSHKGTPIKLRDLKMNQLYKQILSDRERLAFLPEQFSEGEQGEKELMDSIETFHQMLCEQETFEHVKKVMASIGSGDTDLNKIYVIGKSLTELSYLLYGKWDALGYALRNKFVGEKTKKDIESRSKSIEEWIEKKEFSLAQIIEVEDGLRTEHSVGVMELFTTLNVWKKVDGIWLKVNLLDICNSDYITQFLPIKELFDKGAKISNNEHIKEYIKNVLDNYLNLLHVVRLLQVGGGECCLDKDAFYIDYDALFASNNSKSLTLNDIILLYNKIRSFLTRKLCDSGKILLKFDSPTLAKGWDVNKESSNNATILSDGINYFLLIANPANKPIFNDAVCEPNEDSCLKIEYKQIADVGKDLPNLLLINGKTVRKTGHKENGVNTVLENLKNEYLPANVNEIRKSKSYLKSSANFSKEDSQTYISYYMDRLIDYYQGKLKFNLKKAIEYDSYTDFIDDVSQQKFSLSFVYVSKKIIKQWISDGRAFLFQIYNKDFKQGAKGTENLHTLYLKTLFSAQNLKESMFQLGGEAELFYRRKANGHPFIHKKNSILVNKRYSNGSPIEAKLYKEYNAFFSKQIIKEQLSDEARKNLQFVRTSVAKLDIIKDSRYYEHKLFFHFPIIMNCKNLGIKNFNNYTLERLRASKDTINIMGVDRGERNLIYISIINQKGENLITPKSLNIINSESYDNINREYNYQIKLKQKEFERDEERKSWNEIETIKDIKSGYLSLVVHDIAKLIVKYNCIVVLEDLNFGFKRGRFSVERQVYQNFEKILINKLNYLVFKKNAPSEDYGTVLNGLQLTAPFTSFKDIGKQSGWLFYVPANYTSKIDPMTGFVNLFDMKKAKEDTRSFFSNFKSIVFEDGFYKFTFDYENFNTVQTDYRKIWTVCSYGRRITTVKEKQINKNGYEVIDLTEALKDFFKVNGLTTISLGNILEKDDKAFFDQLFYYFKLILQMRNSTPQNSDNEKCIDYLVSPVMYDTKNKLFFHSDDSEISDADANGAYHIALKGLYWLMNDFPTEKKGYLRPLRTDEWLRFAQEKPYINNK